MISFITGVHKHESCRHFSRKLRILTLTSLYILEVFCFIKSIKWISNRTSECNVIIWEINLIYTHTSVETCCIREVWQKWALNYLINSQHKSNNWTVLKVLRENENFSFIQFILCDWRIFCTLREYSYFTLGVSI